MPETLSETASFDATITIPVDGEAAAMPTMKAWIQKLVNRSKYLKELLEPTTPVARTVYVNPLFGSTPTKVANDWSAVVSGGSAYLQTESDAAYVVIDIGALLPSGATLTAVRALVKPGAARVSPNGMTLRAYRATHDFVTPAASTSTGLGGGSDEDDGTANVQILSQTGLSEVVDKTLARSWNLLIVGGNNSGTNKDRVYAVELQFTDPGPRNY
jgi:hypothetical protein